MSENQQKTLRMIASGLSKRPAYLLLFGLGVLGGGVAGTFSLFADDGGRLGYYIIGCFFTFLIFASLIVLRVESTVKPVDNSVIPDEEAKKEFKNGPDASRLSGIWEMCWQWPTVDCDMVTLSVSGTVVFGVSFDDEHKRTYWFLGRIDEDGDLPALFWGRDGNGPVGSAFMKREGHSRFVGTWKGVNKDDEDGHCDVTLERKG